MTTAPYQNVLLDREGAVARITLNRPDAMNVLDLALVRELHHAVRVCADDPSVRALVLTGAGRMFCAGGDLKSVAAAEDPGTAMAELVAALHETVEALQTLAVPVIAAVNGSAAGAGMSLVAAVDYAIAAEPVKFTMAYTGVGMTPDGGSTWFLPRLIGLRRAKSLMLLNRPVTAPEALAMGLVDEVVSTEGLTDAVGVRAAQLASGPRAAFASIKRLLASGQTQSLHDQLQAERASIVAQVRDPEGREGLDAFFSKRAPVFP